VDQKIKEARRKHKLKRSWQGVGSWLAIILFAVFCHRFQWNMAMEAGLSNMQAVLAILLAGLCVISFVVIPIWHRLNK